MNKDMTELNESRDEAASVADRRRVLQAMGMAAVAVPVLGLSACGGDSGPEAGATGAESAPSTPEMPETAEMETAMESVQEEATEAMDEASEAMAEATDAAEEAAGSAMDNTIATDAIAEVDENGPQAMGLGYRHDATTVTASVQTRYAAGQMCSNCVLFQGGDQAWGGCPLFAGQNVKATGWCSAYSAAS